MFKLKRDYKKFHHGYDDQLESLEPLNLGKIKDFDELTKAMSKTAFGGRKLGEAVDVLYQMITDKDCFVVGTFAGAMTVAKMGLLVCDMIDQGMIQAVVTTGALMTHGLVEEFGMTHFKYNEKFDDSFLYQHGYNRVYDTIELEKNLDDLELLLFNVLKKLSPDRVYGSVDLNEKIGDYLNKTIPKSKRAILKSAFLNKAPVYIPAFSDSEYALDIGIFNRLQKDKKKKGLVFDELVDLEHFTELIKKQKKIGIFTIGGGVPRNWAQQVCPYLDVINKRVGHGGRFIRYHYSVRICPEPAHWGGLSGCTYTEGVSWGKVVSEKEGGRFAEVLADATIAWPIILKAVMERLKKNKISIKKNFQK